ncbi:hypothetical protein ACW18Z_07405 [Limosilactobacillus fermentum]
MATVSAVTPTDPTSKHQGDFNVKKDAALAVLFFRQDDRDDLP